MESKIAKEAERALIEATQRLSPEERVNAFLAHCRLVMELFEAGQKVQIRQTQSAAVPRSIAAHQEFAGRYADPVNVGHGRDTYDEGAACGAGTASSSSRTTRKASS